MRRKPVYTDCGCTGESVCPFATARQVVRCGNSRVEVNNLENFRVYPSTAFQLSSIYCVSYNTFDLP